MLTLKDIHFSYGEKKILNGLNFSIHPGEIVALIGISGSGKTTLFKLIAGLIEQHSGTLFPKSPEMITYMGQEDLLLPWRTILDNLLLFTELGKKLDKKEYTKKAMQLLERVALPHTEKLYPHQLSGGMKQRVSLARALLQERPLLLLDEPFGSLDLLIREELYKILLEIRTQYNKTMILVTHDFRDALILADRILILKKGTIQSSFSINNLERQDPIFCNDLSQKIKSALAETA